MDSKPRKTFRFTGTASPTKGRSGLHAPLGCPKTKHVVDELHAARSRGLGRGIGQPVGAFTASGSCASLHHLARDPIKKPIETHPNGRRTQSKVQDRKRAKRSNFEHHGSFEDAEESLPAGDEVSPFCAVGSGRRLITRGASLNGRFVHWWRRLTTPRRWRSGRRKQWRRDICIIDNKDKGGRGGSETIYP
ncbi:hypothetical protein BHE74_00019452 [Ensete ventricosum]|nr:hypothetical protein BHE74_00019452 [Ensete ventricosum]